MILYIAGPMSGYPALNYPAFIEAEKRLLLKGYAVLNPVRAEEDNPTPGVPQPWDWYMRKAIAMVLRAEGIALLPDWECSPGACLEVHIAHVLRVMARPLAVW